MSHLNQNSTPGENLYWRIINNVRAFNAIRIAFVAGVRVHHGSLKHLSLELALTGIYGNTDYHTPRCDLFSSSEQI